MSELDIEGGPSINLVRAGPRGGPPIVFLHALGFDLTWWDRQIAEFGHDHDVVALDLPGHGRSGGLDGPPTFATMARIVAGVLAHVDAGPAHVVGLSVGGMIAQMLALSRPELVRSLSLVATSCTFPEAARQAIRERARVSRAGGMAAIAPLSIERWFPPGFRARRPDVLDRAAKLLLRQDPEFHATLWDMVASLDLERDLAILTCPTMVVAGGEDVSAPVAAGRVIADRIAGATLSVAAACGHFPPVEAPEEFNALLRAFLHRA